MQNTQLLIKKFELINDKNGGVFLYTPEVTAHIKNKNFILLLEELQKKSTLTLDLKQLNELIDQYELVDAPVKDYLLKDVKIISMLMQDRFDKLIIMTNNSEVENTIGNHFKEKYDLTIECNNLALANDKSIIVAFEENYNAQKMEDIYLAAEQSNSWVLSSYIAHHYFIIDNLFNAEKGMPCHFCNMQRFKNIVRSKNNLKQTSWINFCRRLLENDINLIPAMRLTNIEFGLVIFWLTRTIKNFIDPHSVNLFINDVGRYTTVNLINAEVANEHASHWMFCKCLSKDLAHEQ